MDEENKVEEFVPEAADDTVNEAAEPEETENEAEETAEEAKNQEAEEQDVVQEIGNIKISLDVVATIAGIATTEMPGVACMYSSFAGGIAERLGAKKSPSKGVKVDMTDTSANIDLYIVVDYGVRIPELAWEIQENVKNNVETMTGLSVDKVNIHIEGVNFAPDDGAKEADSAIEAMEEPEVLPEAELVSE